MSENSGYSILPNRRREELKAQAERAAERRQEAMTRALSTGKVSVKLSKVDSSAENPSSARAGFQAELTRIVRNAEGPVVQIGTPDSDDE